MTGCVAISHAPVALAQAAFQQQRVEPVDACVGIRAADATSCAQERWIGNSGAVALLATPLAAHVRRELARFSELGSERGCRRQFSSALWLGQAYESPGQEVTMLMALEIFCHLYELANRLYAQFRLIRANLVRLCHGYRN